jgi:hypothetical protein
VGFITVYLGIYGGGGTPIVVLDKEGLGFTVGETLAFTFSEGAPEFTFDAGQPAFTFRDDSSP